MLRRWAAWWGALTVSVITAGLVVLDISDGSVHRYWTDHSFTASVLSGVLVLLVTVLIIDRVTRRRQLRGRSRAIAAQAAIIVAQAARATDAVTHAADSAEDRDAADDELRTYMQMLLTSAPVLIDADVSRRFLEAAQRVAGDLYRSLQAPADDKAAKPRLDESVAHLRAAAAPLLDVLNPEQRAAISSFTSR